MGSYNFSKTIFFTSLSLLTLFTVPPNILSAVNKFNIGMDSFGNSFAVWEELSEEGKSVVNTGKLMANTNNWSSVKQLSWNGQDAREPVIAVNAMGNAAAIWKGHDENRGNAYLCGALFINGIWSESSIISGIQDEITGDISLQINDIGNVVASWHCTVSDGGSNSHAINFSTASVSNSKWTPMNTLPTKK